MVNNFGGINKLPNTNSFERRNSFNNNNTNLNNNVQKPTTYRSLDGRDYIDKNQTFVANREYYNKLGKSMNKPSPVNKDAQRLNNLHTFN